MWPLLRFLFFNVALPTVDVVTDLINFFTLLPDHPYWAHITLTWMFTSFSVHSALFFIKAVWTDNKRKTCGQDFYREVVIHFPGVATFNNLWLARRLYQLKWGTKDLKTEDHKEVEEILAEAGRYSHGESMYEAGPQSVTQVKYQICRIEVWVSKIRTSLIKPFSAGDSLEHRPVELFPAFLLLHIPPFPFMGSFQV